MLYELAAEANDEASAKEAEDSLGSFMGSEFVTRLGAACKMIDDWDIRHNRADLSPELWQYLRDIHDIPLLTATQEGNFLQAWHGHVSDEVASAIEMARILLAENTRTHSLASSSAAWATPMLAAA